MRPPTANEMRELTTPEDAPPPYLTEAGAIDWDAVNEDVYQGDLFTGSDFPPECLEGSLFLHVSDHGNAELYRADGGRWISLWSRV